MDKILSCGSCKYFDPAATGNCKVEHHRSAGPDDTVRDCRRYQPREEALPEKDKP